MRYANPVQATLKHNKTVLSIASTTTMKQFLQEEADKAQIALSALCFNILEKWAKTSPKYKKMLEAAIAEEEKK